MGTKILEPDSLSVHRSSLRDQDSTGSTAVLQLFLIGGKVGDQHLSLLLKRKLLVIGLLRDIQEHCRNNNMGRREEGNSKSQFFYSLGNIHKT